MVRRGRRPKTTAAVASATSASTTTITTTATTTLVSSSSTGGSGDVGEGGVGIGIGIGSGSRGLYSRGNKNNLTINSERNGVGLGIGHGLEETDLKRNNSGNILMSNTCGSYAGGKMHENHQHFASPKRKDCKVDKQLQVESYVGLLGCGNDVVEDDVQLEVEVETLVNKSENSAPNIVSGDGVGGDIVKINNHNNNKINGKKTRGRGGGGRNGDSEASKAVGVPLATRAQTRTIEIFFQNKHSSHNDDENKANGIGNSHIEDTEDNVGYDSTVTSEENSLQTLKSLSPVISVLDSEEDNSNGTEYSETTCAGANALLHFAGVNLNAYRDVSLSSSFRSSNSEAENIFLQEPVLTLNVDKSPIQAACCVKINKSLDSEPIFSSPPSNLATAALNGRFSQIVSLHTSPLKGAISIMGSNGSGDLVDFSNSANCFDYKSPPKGFTNGNNFITTNNNNTINNNNNNNNNTLNISNGYNEENLITTTPLGKSSNANITAVGNVTRSGRKPTTPHRILVCGSPIKTKSHMNSSITTSPSKRNASNKDDLIIHQSPRKSQRHMLSTVAQASEPINDSTLALDNPAKDLISSNGGNGLMVTNAGKKTTNRNTNTGTTTKTTRRRLNQKGLDLYLAGNNETTSLSVKNSNKSSSSTSTSSTTSTISSSSGSLTKTSSKKNSNNSSSTSSSNIRQRSQLINGFKTTTAAAGAAASAKTTRTATNRFINGHITANDDDDLEDYENLQDEEILENNHHVHGRADHEHHVQVLHEEEEEEDEEDSEEHDEECNENLNKIKQKPFIHKLTTTTAQNNHNHIHHQHLQHQHQQIQHQVQQKSQNKFKQGSVGGIAASQKTLKTKNSSNHLVNHGNQPLALTNGNREMTEFFPLRRRSERKTKTAVKEEMMRNLEQAILAEREEGLKIGYFENKGRGVIADRHFTRGEFVVEYVGDLISINEASEREKRYALDENAGCYMYYFKHKNQQYCIDATEDTGKLGRLVNHSRNGNLVTKVVVVKQRPHLVLIAKDNIQPGEELTYDYGDRSKLSLLHHPWLAF